MNDKITNVSLTTGEQKPTQRQPIEQVVAPKAPAIDPANLVTVKAIRTFHGEEGWKNPESEPFEVSRGRAADLFGVGLIEYVDQAKTPEAKDAGEPEHVSRGSAGRAKK